MRRPRHIVEQPQSAMSHHPSIASAAHCGAALLPPRSPLSSAVPYGALQEVIDLSSAVVRLPPPPLVEQVLNPAPHRRAHMRAFADEATAQLPHRIAARASRFFREPLSPANVLITHGVRDALGHLIETHDKAARGALLMPPCFPGYAETFRSQNVPTVTVRLRVQGERHRFNLERIQKIFTGPTADKNPGIVIATTPNTPTNSFPIAPELRSLHDLCEQHARLLVVDNTFDTFDLANPWSPPQLSHHSAVLVGSISEAFSLSQCNIQIGYLVGSAQTIARLRQRGRGLPAPPSAAAITCAYIAMFESDSYLEHRNAEIKRRHAFAARLAQLPHVTSMSEQAGTTKWISFESEEYAQSALMRLAAAGIKVKAGSDYGSPQSLRVSLVNQPHWTDFTAAIESILRSIGT